MTETTKIQLNLSAILNVPLQVYNQDFTFVINQEEFHTTKIISDLLSPKISQIHLIDPTFDTYTINTTNRGHFSYILELFKFNAETIPTNELPFISEILEKFANDQISINLPKLDEEITLDNIIKLIKTHENNYYFYDEYLREEIDFISKHLFEFTEEQENQLQYLNIDILERILSHSSIQLRDENQLLNILNQLYRNNSKYSNLYKFVYFTFVDEEKMNEFIEIFDYNDLNSDIWQQLSNRLKEKIDDKSRIFDHNDHYENHFYKPRCKIFECKHDNQFDGIIKYLQKESNGNIQNMINITSSQLQGQSYSQYNVCLFDDNSKYFHTTDQPNSWICFDFKEHKIIPSNYIIRTGSYGQNSYNPKTWVIEGSNDQTKWEILDEQKENPYLNGQYLVHTFDITKKITTPFQYIRMKQTGPNFYNNQYHYFTLGSIEFYGQLI